MIAEPEAFALDSAAAELFHAIVGGSVVELEAESVVIDDPEAFALASGVAEPDVVFAAVVSVADVAGPQACVDTPVPFDVSAPASAVVVEVDSSGHPRFRAFPNVGHYAIPSSSVEVGG